MTVECFIIFYNQEKFVDQRLSNLFKIFNPSSVTIIDDFSSDNTDTLIKKFLLNHKLNSKYIRNTSNKGIIYNWNLCCDISKREYVSILEGDDLTHQNFFVRFEKIRKRFNLIDLFSGVSFTINDKNKITGMQTEKSLEKLNIQFLKEYKMHKFSELNFLLSIVNFFPNIGSFIFRRKILELALNDIKKYSLDVKYAFDWILYYTLSKQKNINFFFDLKAINYFKIHNNNLSQKNIKMHRVNEINLVYKYIDYLQNNKISSNIKRHRKAYLNSLCDKL